MKKILYILSFMLPLFALSSCNDSDDFPQVDVTVTFNNAAGLDNQLYVVAGSDLVIEDVAVKSLTNKPAGLTNVNYYWDYEYVTNDVVNPYPVSFNTMNAPIGRHLLQMTCAILQEDKSIAYSNMSFVVNIVGSEDEIPDGASAIGQVIFTTTVNPKADKAK